MVNLTRIYTRTGDAGQTRLGDMSTTSKNDLRLHAYADVDEANAHIGAALALGSLDDDVVQVLTTVQNDLFDVGADLCVPGDDPSGRALRVQPGQVQQDPQQEMRVQEELHPSCSSLRGSSSPSGLHSHPQASARPASGARSSAP